MRWQTDCNISGSNEQLQQELEYILLKPDCHSWWISKMQSGHDDTLEEWYAIKFCFELGKNATEMYECFKLLFDHLAWIKHQFLSGIRDSRKVGSLWGMMRGVGGVRKSIHHSWLAKWLGLLCWGFKGVQQEIPSVVMRQLRRWKRLWRRSLTRSHKKTSMGPSRSCWNSTTSALQLEEITLKGTRVSCVYYQ